jgi:hypothetical protein
MKRLEDRLDDIIEPLHHVDVPEAQNAIAGRSQEIITPLIVGHLLSVLAAVEFNDELAIERGKVTDIEADLMLAAEFEAGELPPPEATPKKALGVRLVTTKSAGVAEHV